MHDTHVDTADTIARTPASIDRRNLLSGSGGSALAALAAAMGVALSAHPAEAQAINDADILNFALNFEYLGAEYYTRAVTGHGLAAADTTGGIGQPSGGVTGGRAVPFVSTEVREFAAELAMDEVGHARFIRATLGRYAIAEPAINFTDAFNAIAKAAGLGSSFDPFANEDSFLLGAYVFEDVCVTALRGAAPLIQYRSVLGAAAGFLGVEGYQAAAIRLMLYRLGTAFQVATQRISALRATLSQAADDQGVVLDGLPNIVPTDANSLVFARTPRQVLNIAYGAINASKGGFFPEGVNGTIR